MDQNNIRNFCIIAHIDHGKSTLADRMLELTGTVEKREMKEQLLDQMDLERERGITIKLAPVRMLWTRTDADETRKSAEGTQNGAEGKLLYEDLTYKIRGAIFNVKKNLGLGHKENIYQKALIEELKILGLCLEIEKEIAIKYNEKKIGTYRPDIIIDDKIIIELKALPFIGKKEKTQAWTYLKGSDHKLLLLVNFGSTNLEIERIVYDTARDLPRQSAFSPRSSAYILNLIDTPGHVDFSYEVSRSLAAVEGAVLLVDASQGIEAQTLSTLYAAMEHDLEIIPVVNKIDLPAARPDEVAEEIVKLIGCKKSDIIFASGKTGAGVSEILNQIVEKIPSPRGEADKPLRALIFDSIYDKFRGVVAYIRVFDGSIKNHDEIILMQNLSSGRVEEVGTFKPKYFPYSPLSAGEIGYLVTGFMEVSEARVGDTITIKNQPANSPLPGYKEVKPYVYASIFCTEGDKYPELKVAISKLKLNDASLSYEPERSDMLGFGFRCGFLGLLHMDIVRERLEREFDLDLVITTPNVIYKIKKHNGEESEIFKASDLPTPGEYLAIYEPWSMLEIVTPKQFIGGIMEICQNKRAIYKNTQYLDENRVLMHYEMPLSELIVDFYDQLKSTSEGYASLNYEMIEFREAKLAKIDILVAEDKVDALSFVTHADKSQREARRIVERLKELIPRQNFEVKVQAAIGSNIIASEKIPAMRKDVIAKLYGGDVTRKNKLLDKQKKGKKKMKQIGKVAIPSDVFIKVLRNE